MARITHLLISALSLLSTVSLLSVQGVMGSDFSSLNSPWVNSSEPDLTSFNQSDISFASFFTFSPNFAGGAFDQNTTTLAFVLVPSSLTSVSLTTARETWSLEFTSTISACSTPGGGDGPGPTQAVQGFQVSEYADSSPVSGETNSPTCEAARDGSTMTFCSHQDAPYEVLVEYNATTKTVFVASPSCECPSYINFTVDLSSIVDKKLPLQIGFIVSDEASYNVSNANFSVITAPTIFLASFLQTTPETPPATANSTSSSDSPGGSSQKIGKGYVVAFSVLGSGIAVAAALGVFLLCRRRAAKRSVPAAPFRQVQDEEHFESIVYAQAGVGLGRAAVRAQARREETDLPPRKKPVVLLPEEHEQIVELASQGVTLFSQGESVESLKKRINELEAENVNLKSQLQRYKDLHGELPPEVVGEGSGQPSGSLSGNDVYELDDFLRGEGFTDFTPSTIP